MKYPDLHYTYVLEDQAKGGLKMIRHNGYPSDENGPSIIIPNRHGVTASRIALSGLSLLDDLHGLRDLPLDRRYMLLPTLRAVGFERIPKGQTHRYDARIPYDKALALQSTSRSNVSRIMGLNPYGFPIQFQID